MNVCQDCAEERDRMIAAMARVWAHLEDNQRDWNHFASMGDVLYHATNGEKGACAEYDECKV